MGTPQKQSLSCGSATTRTREGAGAFQGICPLCAVVIARQNLCLILPMKACRAIFHLQSKISIYYFERDSDILHQCINPGRLEERSTCEPTCPFCLSIDALCYKIITSRNCGIDMAKCTHPRCTTTSPCLINCSTPSSTF